MKLKEILLATLLVPCLLTACTAEEQPGGTEQQPVAPGETGLFTFAFDAGTFATVDTRAIDESTLHDVWVVQLNATGTAALVPPVQVTSIGSDQKVRVKLKAEESKVYFFANTDNASLFNTSAALNTFTTATVEATNISRTSNWGDMSYTPMFGTWPATGTGTPTTPTISGTTELTRCLSHVSVTVKNETGGNLVISSIQLRNVPNVLQLCPSTASAYPAATGTYLDYSATTSLTSSYYMAENCRGTGIGRYETEKTASAVTGGAYATYVEVKGKYRNMIDMTYRFYLGENATNNYNVKRNTKYTVTITIKGMNNTDMRVEWGGKYPITTAYDMNPGNFYYSDGTWSDGGYRLFSDGTIGLWEDITLTEEQKSKCIGIVYWVGDITGDNYGLLKTKGGTAFSRTRGLVVSLWDMKDGTSCIAWMRWQICIKDQLSVIGFNVSGYDFQATDKMQGYVNTLALEAYNAPLGGSSTERGKRVVPVTLLSDYRSAYPVPVNSSDWYWPSFQEVSYMCWGQGNSSGMDGKYMLDAQIAKAGGMLLDKNSYMPSTEVDFGHVWRMSFSQSLWYNDMEKAGYCANVRPILAF